jgi:hypothetical protein
MMDWWHEIDGERSRDDEKAERLVRVLSKLPGPPEAKLKWLKVQMPLLEAQAGQLFDPEKEPRKFGAAMCSLTFRYWRGHLRQMGRPRMNWDRERPQELGPRDNVVPFKR